MRFSIGVAAVAVASVSNAFLLPPTIPSVEKDFVNALPFDGAIPIDSRNLDVDCRDCPVSFRDIQGVAHDVPGPFESILKFNFSIAHGEKSDTFLLNGIPFYPVGSLLVVPETLTADQAIKIAPSTFQYVASPEIGYGLNVHHAATSPEEGLRIVEITFDVFEVGGNFVNSVPIVELKLLETPSGKLMIGDIGIVHSLPGMPSSAPGLPAPGQECTNIICKWKAIIAAKLANSKGCGGKRPQHGPDVHKAGHGKHGGHGHPHGGRPHGVNSHGAHRTHRHHHHKHGRVARIMRAVVLHFVIPVLVGASVGVAATILGLLIGHFAIFAWRLLFRRTQPAADYQKVQQDEAAVDDESKSFIKHQIPPPVYEDTPAYEEAADEKTPL